MNIENSFKKFEKLMADFSSGFITPLYKKMQENNEMYIEQTSFEFQIFRGYTEISTSYETLLLIEKFIKINPPDSEGINHSNYLNYHIHNYLQEMYILKDRLDRYLKLITERYKADFNQVLLDDIKINLLKFIKGVLQNITGHTTGARSKHVHYERFFDEEMKWLSSTTLLAQFHDEFKIESKKAYIDAKNKWHGLIQNNNVEVLNLFDTYFNVLFHIITIDGKIHLPKQ